MDKRLKRVLSVIILVFSLLSVALAGKEVVETQHFKIIYDERTENAAKEIYSFVEDAYSELVEFFREDPKLYLPIYIEPDEKDYNAYFTSFPYNRIVVYDAPVSTTLDNTENTFYMTFLHELTHAFTFSFKDLHIRRLGEYKCKLAYAVIYAGRNLSLYRVQGWWW